MDIDDFPLHGCELHKKYIDELRSKSLDDCQHHCDLVSLIHSYVHAMMDSKDLKIREYISASLLNLCKNDKHSRTVFSYFAMNTIYGKRCGHQSFNLLSKAAAMSTFPKRRVCTIAGSRSVSYDALNTPLLHTDIPSVEVVFEDDDEPVVV